MTRTKLFGTFITAACMRVISSAILAFVSSDTQPCSMIAVYNGIRVTSTFGRSQETRNLSFPAELPTSICQLESGGHPRSFLKLRPREQIPEIRLKKIRLRFIRSRRRLAAVRDQDGSLRKLI